MTHPEVFAENGVRYSIDPFLNKWRATFLVDGECEIERTLRVNVRPSKKLSASERAAVIKACEERKFI